MNPIDRFKGKHTSDYRYFANDFSEIRMRQWLSVWMQASPSICREDVHSVLEFGGGRDVTRSIVRQFGIEYFSVDMSSRFFPDHVSSILDFPFEGRMYDLVCSFQCLEHNPYEDVPALIKHMSAFSRKYLHISVPYNGASFTFDITLRLPKFEFSYTFSKVLDNFGGKRIDVKPLKERPPEKKHLAHWWEVGRPGLSKKKFVRDIEECGLTHIESKHNPLFPHHLFLLFEKIN